MTSWPFDPFALDIEGDGREDAPSRSRNGLDHVGKTVQGLGRLGLLSILGVSKCFKGRQDPWMTGLSRFNRR